MPSIKQAAGADKAACDCSCGTSCSAGYTAACGCCIPDTLNVSYTNGIYGIGSFSITQSGGVWTGCQSYTAGRSVKFTYQCTGGVMVATVDYYTGSSTCSGSSTGSCASDGSAPNLIPESLYDCTGGVGGDQFTFDKFTVTNANCPGLFAQGFGQFTVTP